ncbi:MAG: putative 3-methyladenine DNA glycosylase [Candidatus Parcubacteria bacterium]|nr:MAG: putative 3-methyladenine DNA glycosylase [Candidatus Parcubacteria bacterium]
MRLKRNFFTRRTLDVAKDLLGKLIVRVYNKNIIIGKIVETEAYIGPKDKASHAYAKKEQKAKEKIKILNCNWYRIKKYVKNKNSFFKRVLKCKKCKITPRNIAEYLKGGHIYIYLVYGNYYQFNITTFKEGYPECVLIRALEPINYYADYYLKPNGPGKLCEFLKLNKYFWGVDICQSEEIFLTSGEKIKKNDIIKTKRIGIDYAEEYKDKLWRFYIKNNKYVSKK